MSAAMLRRLAPWALLAFSSTGCGEPRLLESFSEGLTRMRLSPATFLGSTACQSGADGALRSYVARVQELGVDAGFTTVFTTEVVPCSQSVLFPVTPGRLYGAEIYGFAGDAAEAAPDLNSAGWTAVCGRGAPILFPADGGLDPYRPTVAIRGVTQQLRGCTLFSDGEPGGTRPLLAVDQASALGTLSCGQGAGEVSSFRATLGGRSTSAACGAPLLVEVPVANRFFTIELTAFEGGGAPIIDAGAPPAPAAPDLDAGLDAAAPLDASVGIPDTGAPPEDAGPTDAGAITTGVARWQTRCIGRALSGLTTPAYCDPLQPLP
jgi:hypothetical protein